MGRFVATVSVQGVGSDGLIKHPISACDSVPGQGFMVTTVTCCSGVAQSTFVHSGFWAGCHWMYSIFYDSRRLHLPNATWKHLSINQSTRRECPKTELLVSLQSPEVLKQCDLGATRFEKANLLRCVNMGSSNINRTSGNMVNCTSHFGRTCEFGRKNLFHRVCSGFR